MQQKTTNVCRIPIQVVQENEGNANFKAFKHHMWIQATRDPQKKWLEMQYCASREEVEWIVKDNKKGAKPKQQEKGRHIEKDK
jgi:hypothetical protein